MVSIPLITSVSQNCCFDSYYCKSFSFLSLCLMLMRCVSVQTWDGANSAGSVRGWPQVLDAGHGWQGTCESLSPHLSSSVPTVFCVFKSIWFHILFSVCYSTKLYFFNHKKPQRCLVLLFSNRLVITLRGRTLKREEVCNPAVLDFVFVKIIVMRLQRITTFSSSHLQSMPNLIMWVWVLWRTLSTP